MATPVGVAAQEPSDDRHAGYYYPEHGTPEVYDARAYTLPDASRKARIAFVTSITNEQNKAPYPPQAAIFAQQQRRNEGSVMCRVARLSATNSSGTAVCGDTTMPASGIDRKSTRLNSSH